MNKIKSYYKNCHKTVWNIPDNFCNFACTFSLLHQDFCLLLCRFGHISNYTSKFRGYANLANNACLSESML